MLVSVATANFYFLPFEETLDIIAEAGFHNIELDLYWEWNHWAMAQHLKDVSVLHTFVIDNGFGVTFDTTHYAYINLDLLWAVRILQGSIRSVHLSDFQSGKAHVFVGEGSLPLADFLSLVNLHCLDAVTLECSVSSVAKTDREMNHTEIVNRLNLAKEKVENLLAW